MDRTIHFIGDTHLEQYTASDRAQQLVRWNKFAADIAKSTVGTPQRRIFVGDLIENFGDSDGRDRDALAKAAADALLPACDWEVVLGNHDLAGRAAEYRTADVWAALYGYSDQNWTLTLTDALNDEFVKLISIGTDTMDSVVDPPILISLATQNWLNTELGNTTLPCLILCHAPLKDTVLGPGFDSSAAYFYVHSVDIATDDTLIRAILNANTNAKAWISGHTHSSITNIDFCKSENVGARSIAAISTSSLWYVTALPATWYDPIVSLFLTVLDDRIEVRFRDHGAGIWTAVDNDRVWTFTF